MSFLDTETEQTPELIQRYKTAIENAKHEDYYLFKLRGLMRYMGKDIEGNEVLLFVPCLVTATGTIYDHALNYCLSTLTEKGLSPFVLIFAESMASWITGDTLQFVRDLFSILPNKIKKNIIRVYMLHASTGSQGFISFYSSFYSADINKKIIYLDKLADVIKTLQMPNAQAIKLVPYCVQVEEERRLGFTNIISVYGVSLGFLSDRLGFRVSSSLNNIPNILIEYKYYLFNYNNIYIKDLFLLQSACKNIYAFIGDIDTGNPNVDWLDTPSLSSSFRLLLEGLDPPLFGPNAFNAMQAAAAAGGGRSRVISEMKTLFMNVPHNEKQCVMFILLLLQEVSRHSARNLMTPQKLAEIFAASFFRPADPTQNNFPQTVALCIEALAIAIADPSLVHDGYSLNDSSSSSSSSSSEDESSSSSSGSEEDSSSSSSSSSSSESEEEEESEDSSSSSSSDESSLPNGTAAAAAAKAKPKAAAKPAAKAPAAAAPAAAPAAAAAASSSSSPSKSSSPAVQTPKSSPPAAKRPPPPSSSSSSSSPSSSSEEEEEDDE